MRLFQNRKFYLSDEITNRSEFVFVFLQTEPADKISPGLLFTQVPDNITRYLGANQQKHF